MWLREEAEFKQKKFDKKDNIEGIRKRKQSKNVDYTKGGWKVRAKLQLSWLSKAYINLLKKKK